MKFIIQVILTILLSYVAVHFFPWWIIVICSAIVAIGLPLHSNVTFWGGFTAISLFWMLTATWIDVNTHSILSSKIAPLLGLQGTTLLILLTGFTGGIVGGLGALSGQKVRILLTRRDTKRPVHRY